MGKAVIAIHGGAGAISRAQMTPEREREYVAALSTIVESGQKMLAAGASALDAVTEAVRLLEECPLFNAGMGAVFTRDQTHELDACVMDGYSLQAGAVAGVKHLRNPVLAARLVLEKSPHVLLIGEGAENFAISHGMARVDNDLFSTPERLLQLQEAKAGGEIILDHHAAPLDERQKMGTVGAVALDLAGNLAAATSTGGMTNKLPGRVGDSPLPGAGCYANNASVAVSCTGTGEVFMRTLAAYDIAALMEGAAQAMEALAAPGADNPAWQYAAARHGLYQAGKKVELLACYEPPFRFFAEWWKQLYGESEGKDGKGLFPASVVFSTDLHSLGQFVQDGSNILFETVVLLDKAPRELTIEEDPENVDGLNFLTGKTMDFVNKKAFEGTVLAHTDGGPPSLVIHVPEAKEEALGYLIYFFEKACAISGYMLGVNPFDQPGVEAYKKNMFALLGKPGYEEMKQKLESRL